MGVFDVHESDIPAIQIAKAIGNGVEKNLLFVVSGGLGDRVCAVPTLIYAKDTFKNCEISILCDTPELFKHIGFKNVYRTVDEIQPNKHYILYTYGQGNLRNQYFNANLIHPVDFASISALRMQLPNGYKEILLTTEMTNLFSKINFDPYKISDREKTVVIHPGKTWPSRTIPATWWNNLIELILRETPLIPVIIGNDTVEINPDRCFDIRGITNVKEFAWICKYAGTLVTNDSSPIHLGAAGYGKILFFSTVRHPDHLLHWRGGRLGWNMKNLTKGEPWGLFNYCPNNLDENRVDTFPKGARIEDFLPDPKSVLNWILNNQEV
jgi:hypothetical protein